MSEKYIDQKLPTIFLQQSNVAVKNKTVYLIDTKKQIL